MAASAGEEDLEPREWTRASSMPGDVAEDDVVLFGVPKKGRIHEEVMKLLKGAGFEYKRPDRLDVAMCKNLPIKLVFLPAADIPSYVMEGSVHVGISGSDMLEETLADAGVSRDSESAPIKVLRPLGIGKCKLCLQAPKEHCDRPPKDFVGKRIVTSFPALSKRFFDQLENKEGKTTSIKVVSGSVEAACGLGLAEAIVDLVETGTTMKAAGLDIVADILETEALLFQQVPSAANGLLGTMGETVSLILQRINGFMTAQSYVMVVCNCADEQLSEVCKIMPSKKSPTITDLKEPGWHSVSGLVPVKGAQQVMDQLVKAGAEDVLSFNLSNTRM
eukprot:TRINITY_DN63841_c0_g1_i1.p1 TRINITY_DN63841_c0_g1~~TRINITY_DN63841_c0_g1_i1.p1  ORF type:complete len:345 (-),score=67.50 TRINITY_DN63841_c0_g1_i1:22-1020(-)